MGADRDIEPHVRKAGEVIPMTTKQVETMLSGVGIPTAYYEFPTPQEGPPYLCFYFSNDNDVKADNSNYVRVDNLIVELYTEAKDFSLESSLEDVLAEAGMVWSKSETHLGDERMYEVIYEMNVIITEETDG